MLDHSEHLLYDLWVPGAVVAVLLVASLFCAISKHSLGHKGEEQCCGFKLISSDLPLAASEHAFIMRNLIKNRVLQNLNEMHS